MGQKVNPHGLRVGVIKLGLPLVRPQREGRRPAGRGQEDPRLSEKEPVFRRYPQDRDRARQRQGSHLPALRPPGVVIGKGGEQIEQYRLTVEKMIGKPVALNIVEVKQVDTNAQLVAENIAQQLEKRIGFRRAMKNAMGRAMRMGARGIKTQVSGRLGGAEIARTEHYHDGTIPCRPCVRTSTMVLLKLRPPTAASVLRYGSTRVRC